MTLPATASSHTRFDHLHASPASGAGSLSRVALRPAALVLVAAILCAPSMGGWFSFSPDSFRYLSIARTLAETGHFPPRQLMAPPGFPGILALFLMLDDTPFLALRVVVSASWAAAAVLTYLLHRRELGDGLGWVAGLFVATSPVLLSLTTTPLSESVYIPILVASLLLMDAWRRRPATGWAEVALGGLLAAAVHMTRSMGIVLLPVMAVTLLRHRGQTPARRASWAVIFALCSLGPLAAWQIRQSIHPPALNYRGTWMAARGAENSSATGLALQAERFSKYGPLRLEGIKETVLPKKLCWRAYHPPWDTPTTWLIGGFFVAVALVRVIRYHYPIDAFALLTLVLLSLWPWDEGVRFVAPLIPIFVGYPLWIGKVWWRRPRARRWQLCAVAMVILLMLTLQAGGMAVVQSRMPARREKAMRRFAAMSVLADWHKSNRPDGASWMGVAPNLRNSKVLLLGAAFLSRRPVETIDAYHDRRMALPPTSQTCVFVHDWLFDNRLIDHPGYMPTDHVGEFVVLSPESE